MSYYGWDYPFAKRAPSKRASTKAKPDSWLDPGTGLKFPHVYIGADKPTTTSPKVHTPATTASSKVDTSATTDSTVTTESHKEAFEVKVFGYGTDSPTFSITAPSKDLVNTRGTLETPVKIIATVDHDGQQHELCSTFSTFKISNVANEKTDPLDNEEGLMVDEEAATEDEPTPSEDAECRAWNNPPREEEVKRFTPMDQLSALVMEAQKQLKEIRSATAEQAAVYRSTDTKMLFDSVRILSKFMENMDFLTSNSDAFQDKYGQQKEDTKAKILQELRDFWYI